MLSQTILETDVQGWQCSEEWVGEVAGPEADAGEAGSDLWGFVQELEDGEGSGQLEMVEEGQDHVRIEGDTVTEGRRPAESPLSPALLPPRTKRALKR